MERVGWNVKSIDNCYVKFNMPTKNLSVGDESSVSDLCLVVIAKDEGRCILRCLESARPLVDRMVVLDTGSNDDTVGLALDAGATVIRSFWNGSFADARNRCMEAANADWCLVLDADEWIDPGMSRGALDRHTRSARSSGAAGAICIRSIIYADGREGFAETWIPRLVPGSTRYFGSIHEQPVTNSPDLRIDFLVHHDGYSKERAIQKQNRNFEMLSDALKRDSNNPYLNFQIAVQYEAIEKWEKCAEYLARARAYGGDDRPFGHGLNYRLIHALGRISRLGEALEIGLYAQERWPDSSDIQFAFGNTCLDIAILYPSEAVSVWLPAAEAAWLRCIKIGDIAPYGDHVMGRGSYLAAQNLAVLYDGIGNAELAKTFHLLAAERPL